MSKEQEFILNIEKRIIYLCNNQGITQNDLAQRSHLSKPTINKIFNLESKNLRMETLFAICTALDMTLGDFFKSDEFNN